MAYKFKKEISKLIASAENQKYSESQKDKTISFNADAERLTFEQLVKLSKLLQTKSINFTNPRYDEYFGYGDIEVYCSDVIF